MGQAKPRCRNCKKWCPMYKKSKLGKCTDPIESKKKGGEIRAHTQSCRSHKEGGDHG